VNARNKLRAELVLSYGPISMTRSRLVTQLLQNRFDNGLQAAMAAEKK
jgi:hypothetical protein